MPSPGPVGRTHGTRIRIAIGALALGLLATSTGVLPSGRPVAALGATALAAEGPTASLPPRVPASPLPSTVPTPEPDPCIPDGTPSPSAAATPAPTLGPSPSPGPSASAPALTPSSPPDPCTAVASPSPSLDPSAAASLTTGAGLPPRVSPAPAASATPSPSPTPKPSPVRPGGVRTKLDVPMTRRLPCYEFPRDGCINRADIYHPKNKGSWPTVVTIHGRPRTPADMRELALALARRGAVVFNVDYRGVRPVSKGFPESVEDVACAIRFARANTARYGGDPDHIVLVGHSMGGYVGMMVSVAGNRIAGKGQGCLVDQGSSLPDGFVHVAGVSITKASEPLDAIFFGGSQTAIPEVWRRGNVFEQIEQGGNKGLKVGIIFELDDPFLGYAHATWLHATLKREGYDARMVLLDEGHTHFDVLDMDTELGRRILRFTQNVIRRTAP